MKTGQRLNPLMAISTPSDLTRAAEEERQNAPVVLSLASYVRSCWEAANRGRQVMEAKMLSARRQRRGEYEPSKLDQIRKTGGSEIYMMLTAVKCRAAESWLRDALMPTGDRPWSIDPTPVPDLNPEEDAQISRDIEHMVWNDGMVKAMNHGLPEKLAAEQVGLAMPEMSGLLRTLVDEHRKERAKVAAEKMSAKIEDILVEGGWIEAFNALISDITTYPCAFLAGPIIRKRKVAKWVKGASGKWMVRDSDELVVEIERVSPLDIYPSPWSTTVDDGYIIRRHRLSRSDLAALKGVEGYDEAAINGVIEDHGMGGLQEWLAQGADAAQNRNSPIGGVQGGGPDRPPDRPIDALEFWGSVSGALLLEWGVDACEIPDPSIEVDCCIWLIGRWVIKAMLNPDTMGRKPLHKSSYEIIPGEFWGRAVPELIADSQAMCNAAARALANNMGIASGPQVEVNVDRLPDGESITAMYPWKIWQTTNDTSGNGQPAIRFFQPSGQVAELIAIFDRFFRVADDESGVPAYNHSDFTQSGAASTFGGLSILFNASGKGIKSVITNMDHGIIAPVVSRYYEHLMRYDPDETIKGDLRIVAKGASSLIVREQMTLRRQAFLNATLNPIDSQIMGQEGRAELLREVIKTLDLPADKIIPGRAEIAARGVA